jgi:16S rRNA (guanine527-N7)-methyltransferase
MIDVSRETRARLEIYAELLLRWNRTINLVSRRDEAVFWERHIIDALQLRAMMPEGIDQAIDIGSGGGLPGLVLAIATGCRFDLVEADQRKCAFLREAARACDAPVTVHAARIEAVQIPPARLVTARALAPLTSLLPLAARLLTDNGMLIAPKGRNAEAELTAASAEWHMRVARTRSVTDPAAIILQITEVTRVGTHA